MSVCGSCAVPVRIVLTHYPVNPSVCASHGEKGIKYHDITLVYAQVRAGIIAPKNLHTRVLDSHTRTQSRACVHEQTYR